MKTVIVYGPKGCGKTRNAEQLRAKFGCIGVFDDFGWRSEHRAKSGYLHLSNLSLEEIGKFGVFPVEIIPFDQAIKGVR